MAEIGSILAQLNAYRPLWNHTPEVGAPGAATVLSTHTVANGKKGYIFGFFITTTEANNFMLNWVSGSLARSKRIVMLSAGSVESVDPVALNNGLPADSGTAITISNVSAAAIGTTYQTDLLVAEV